MHLSVMQNFFVARNISVRWFLQFSQVKFGFRFQAGGPA